MRITTGALLALLPGAVFARSVFPPPPRQHIVANPDTDGFHNEGFRIPTIRESVAMARKIMHLTTLGDLVTVFPPDREEAHAVENRPAGMGGNPIGLMEYYADCDPHSGNPIMLGINLATPFRNYAAGSNISLGIRWWPDRRTTYSVFDDDDDDDDDEIPTPHTPAALPRFSLHGHLEPLSAEQLESGRIAACFLRAHPDSIYWQPGNDIHTSHYVQLIVEHVYWFGGFGDRSRIGWLPIEDWKNMTMEEVVEAELPGERKRRRRTRSWWRDWL